MKNKIFISYSHEDSYYKSKLETHLKALKLHLDISAWSDSQLETGTQWDSKITQMLQEAVVVILLISKDYLASEYIKEKELPLILSANEQGKLHVIPVILTPCLFHSITQLSKLQAANDPKSPLCNMSEIEQDEIWVRVAQNAIEAVKTAGQTQESEDENEILDAANDETIKELLDFLTDEDIAEITQGLLVPHQEMWYDAVITAVRRNLRADYRCYQLHRPVYSPEFVTEEGETHWLFYRAGEFKDLHEGDHVLFQIKRIEHIRAWPDIGRARNIYISQLFIDGKQ